MFSALALVTALAATTAACKGKKDDKNEAAPAASAATATESQDGGKPDDAAAPDGESADVPAWVNAAYLTSSCGWERVESRTQVTYGCELRGENGERLVPDATMELRWRVARADGEEPTVETVRAGDDDAGWRFTQTAREVSASKTVVTLTSGTYERKIETQLSTSLEGLADGKLAACFFSELPITLCFDAVGIHIPVSDTFKLPIAAGTKTTCDDRGELAADLPCELWTDGMAGDYNFADGWFKKGNELIMEDGTIQAERFCDENGLKDSWGPRPVFKEPRWYPYLGNPARVCLDTFLPKGIEKGSPLFGKRVIFDPAQGKDGEPYCYFILIVEPIVLDERYMRMHILLNPRLFPDKAANAAADVTVEKLEALAEFYNCNTVE